jgi:cardiolipin synthase
MELDPMQQSYMEKFDLFVDGDELYSSMLSTIATAENTIDFESYIFADDVVGNQFAKALVQRAQQGVSIRLHLDAVGSMFAASRHLEKYLRNGGVQVQWFHRWNWRWPWRYNRRNHRKLLVIDNKIAFLGGFNIHKENSRKSYGDSCWRDTHIRFEGPVTQAASQTFDAFWRGCKVHTNDLQSTETVLLHNPTRSCRHRLRCTYMASFLAAKSCIYITTPYFVPDHRLLKHMKQAARRGVDVRLLVPRISDVRIAQWAARHFYASLIKAGVQIYEYLPRVLHAKTVVVDDTWSAIGTANLDYRSFFLNYELTLATNNHMLAKGLREQFLSDLDVSEKILLRNWNTRSRLSNILEHMAVMFRRWL